MLAVSHTTAIRDVLAESFSQDISDGYWYPKEAGTPLVRVYVANGGYCIERRRNERSAWTPIVAADLAEFDADAFRQWRTNWPMTATAPLRLA